MRLLSLSLLLSLVLSACSDAPQNQEQSGMQQFTSDQSFQEAHEEPGDLNYEGIGQRINLPTTSGKDAQAFYFKPVQGSNKYLIVIHEWWGLNDYVKQAAQSFFDQYQNIHVLALDMYDGQVASNRAEASTYMNELSAERAQEIVQAALNFAGADASIATIGWCFGGGWSLKTAIAAENQADACVIYYGSPVESVQELAPLQAPILGIFAEKDRWINHEMIDKFQAICKASKKSFEERWYDADHAFANPSGDRYNENAALEAQKEVDRFLQKHWYSEN